MRFASTLVASWLIVTATCAVGQEKADAPRLEFEMRTHGTRVVLEGTRRNQEEDRSPDRGPETFATRHRISIDADSVSWLDLDSSKEIILDRTRERLVFLDHDKKRVRTRAVLGWIAAIDKERINRLGIAKVLRSADAPSPQTLFDTFWLESLFGFGSDAAGEIEVTDRDGKLQCMRKDELVFEAKHGGATVPDSLASSFERFLIRTLKIHPTIRARLVALDSVPRSIRYRSYDAGARTDFALEIRSWPPDGAKPPRAATIDPAEALSSYSAWVDEKNALDRLLDDIAAKRIETAAVAKKHYAERVRQSTKAGRHLDAFLIVLESSFVYPDTSVRELVQDIDMKSKEIFWLVQIMQLGEKDAAGAEKGIRDVPVDGLQCATTLDILRANYLTDMKRSRDAEKLFLMVLRQKPWLAGPFKDLGDIYASRFEMQDAWRCWQRAHDLAPKHPLLRDFVRLEATLRKRYAAWL